MRTLIILISGIVISVTGTFGLSAQKLYEQTYKIEQALELINRYYVDTVNRERLVDHAVSEMIGELKADSAYVSADEITRLNDYLKYYDESTKLPQALFWIDNNLSDSVNEGKLVEDAISGLLYELDPHSSYLTPEEVEKLNEPLQGNFEGIGVSFNILNDTIYIISPVESGPSARVGILAGDRIIKVDGKNVAGVGITSEKVFELLRGKKGTSVKVSVLRRDFSSVIDFDITRDKIPIYSIDASYKVEGNIGYIKINRFSLTTMDEFKEALIKLLNQNVENLILDLTGNGGGYLEVAVNLADEFLGANKLILYTEGVHNARKEYFATQAGRFEKGHLVILIDEGSASASEILSGAIQDWDCGILVGRRSYGKGLVQRPLMLIDQSMIRLTVARYYTPTGRLIQKPYEANRDLYEKDLQTRFMNGEFVHQDSIHFPDSLKFYTLQNTRLVYGGGGIMPDYFVPLDTSYYSGFYRQVIRKSMINQFILEYVDANRKELNDRYPGFDTFKNDYSINDSLFNAFVDYAKSKGIVADNKDIIVSKVHLGILLKAYIARDLWSGNEFFEITNELEPDFITAIKILKNWNQYEAMLLKNN
jgi:carboxyl-terminal processing protease